MMQLYEKRSKKGQGEVFQDEDKISIEELQKNGEITMDLHDKIPNYSGFNYVGQCNQKLESAEHEDTTGSIPCIEDFSRLTNAIELVSRSDIEILEHERAPKTMEDTACPTSKVNGNIPKKRNKKKLKKTKGVKSKASSNETPENTADAPQERKNVEKSPPNANNTKLALIGRAARNNQRIGGGDDSDSDRDSSQRRIPGGHYVGLPPTQQSDEGLGADTENEDVAMRSKTECMSIEQGDDNSANKSYPVEENEAFLLDDIRLVKQRYVNRQKKKLEENELRMCQLIEDMAVHCSYCSDSSNCRNKNICKLVKLHLEHFMHKRCKDNNCKENNCIIYLRSEIGVLSHSMKCDQQYCSVPNCLSFKEDFQKRHSRRIESTVLHSTTTLFKVGGKLRQDIDYSFLYELKVGKGTYGEVSRVLFYSLKKDVEADIIVKKAKYNLEKEAKLSEVLREDHPNIMVAMTVIAFQRPLDQFKGYILMERAEQSLYDLKKSFKGGCLPMMDALYYFVQIINGLSYLHSKNIVHKDIKDKNILVTQNGERVKIADWDAAQFLEDEMIASCAPTGTRGFAAPEVINKEPHSTAADIYSAGVTFLELAFGNQYWQAYKIPNGEKESESHEAYYKRREENMEFLSKNNPAIFAIIQRCLKPDQKDRSTAKEMMPQLDLLMDPEFKVQLPQENLNTFDHGEAIDMKYLDDIKGDTGDMAREKAEKIQEAGTESILAIMDQLPKVLPSENIPSSNDWIQNIQPEDEQMETSD